MVGVRVCECVKLCPWGWAGVVDVVITSSEGVECMRDICEKTEYARRATVPVSQIAKAIIRKILTRSFQFMRGSFGSLLDSLTVFGSVLVFIFYLSL